MIIVVFTVNLNTARNTLQRKETFIKKNHKLFKYLIKVWVYLRNKLNTFVKF